MAIEGSAEELRKVKIDIRSLLIARSRPVSFKVLARDYKEQLGKPLCYERFGYDTAYDFFNDLKDTVQVETCPWGFGLSAVPHENSKHISQMVAAQKRPRAGRALPSRQRFYSRYQGRYELKFQSVTDQNSDLRTKSTLETDQPTPLEGITPLTREANHLNEANNPPFQGADESSTQEASKPLIQEACNSPSQESSKPPTQEANNPPSQEANESPIQEANCHLTQEASKAPTQEASLPPTQKANVLPIQKANKPAAQRCNQPPLQETQPSIPKTNTPDLKSECHQVTSKPAVPDGMRLGQYVQSPQLTNPPLAPYGFNMIPYYLPWPLYGLPPHQMGPFPWMSWFPPVFPGWPGFGMWDAPNQNLARNQQLNNPGITSTAFNQKNAEGNMMKESGAGSSAPSETCQPALPESDHVRHPAGYSDDDESRESFCQSPCELKFEDTVYYDAQVGCLVPKYAEQTESETVPERSVPDQTCAANPLPATIDCSSTSNSIIPFESQLEDAVHYETQVGCSVPKCAETESKSVPERCIPDPTCAANPLPATIDCPSTSKSIIDDYEDKFRSILMKHPHGVLLRDFLKEYEEENSEPLDVTKLGYRQAEVMVAENPAIFDFSKPLFSNEMTLYDAKCTARLCPIVNRRWVPNNIQDGLATLIKDYPNGVGINDLLSLYREKYSTEINPESLGFKSIEHLLKECSSVCFKEYHDTSLLYPKHFIGLPLENYQLIDADHPSVKDKIKYLWNGHFKANECDPLFKYLPPILPDENMVKVKVVDFLSPDLFWIHFVNNIKRLTELMVQMSIHYEMEEETYHLPDQFVGPGLAVAVLFEGYGPGWHRARIESVEGDEAKIFYVDFGTDETRKLSELRKLDRRFGQDPIYAVKASMFRLRPPIETNEWPEESFDYFYEKYFSNEVIMYAEICLRDTRELDNPAVEIILYNTSGGREEVVNDTFIKMKFASDKAVPTIPKPVVTETVTLNESNVDVISKLLPSWFTTDRPGPQDLDTTLTNLKFSTEWVSRFMPIDPRVVPCCLRHVVQRFFYANPIAVSQLWESASLDVEVMLLKLISSRVLREFDNFEWNSNRKVPIACSTGNTDAS